MYNTQSSPFSFRHIKKIDMYFDFKCSVYGMCLTICVEKCENILVYTHRQCEYWRVQFHLCMEWISFYSDSVPSLLLLLLCVCFFIIITCMCNCVYIRLVSDSLRHSPDKHLFDSRHEMSL